jgi:hypothetical protein
VRVRHFSFRQGSFPEAFPLNPTHHLNLPVAFGIKSKSMIKSKSRSRIKSKSKIFQFRFAETLFRESHQKTMPIMVGGN